MLPKPVAASKKTDTTSSSSASAEDKAKVAAGQAGNLNKKLQVWIKKNYETAMVFVSYYEVIVIAGRVLLGAVT
jgi:hypothetical protein